jgi:hypothetical protein
MILCKEAGEEQPVPVLVRRQFHEVVNALDASTFIAFVAQRPTTGAETIAQKTLFNAHVNPVFPLMDSEILQRCLASRLRQDASLSSGIFKQLAVGFR